MCYFLKFKNTNLSALTNSKIKSLKNQSNGNCIEKSEDVSLLKIIEIMGMTGFDCKMNKTASMSSMVRRLVNIQFTYFYTASLTTL